MTIFVGLDLSLVSPGIAIYKTMGASWSLYGFTQRVREHGFRYTKTPTLVHLFPMIPGSEKTNEARYEHIRHHIVDLVLDRLEPETGESVVVGIECYAFGAKNSGSSYKLQELGGVLKHAIWKRFPGWKQTIIPPSQWKKQTLSNGRATKEDALRFVESHGPCISLLSVLGLTISKNGEIPCPAQDLADAACIVLALNQPIPLVPSTTKKKPGKRKRTQNPVHTTLSIGNILVSGI